MENEVACSSVEINIEIDTSFIKTENPDETEDEEVFKNNTPDYVKEEITEKLIRILDEANMSDIVQDLNKEIKSLDEANMSDIVQPDKLPTDKVTDSTVKLGKPDKSNIDSSSKNYKCMKCNNTYKLMDRLNIHIKSKHWPTKDNNLCGKGFKQAYFLKCHFRNHSGERPYQCTQCPKTFAQPDSLKKHLDVHSERRYICYYCDQAFKGTSYLRQHIKRHAAEKKYICSHCGKGFKHPLDMRNHSKIHTADTPFSCSSCGKQFKLKKHCTRHENIHTGDLSHCCSYCGKLFNQKSNLDIHIRIHTGEKPYKCYYCEKDFRVKCSLVSHMKKHTGENINLAVSVAT